MLYINTYFVHGNVSFFRSLTTHGVFCRIYFDITYFVHVLSRWKKKPTDNNVWTPKWVCRTVRSIAEASLFSVDRPQHHLLWPFSVLFLDHLGRIYLVIVIIIIIVVIISRFSTVSTVCTDYRVLETMYKTKFQKKKKRTAFQFFRDYFMNKPWWFLFFLVS